MPQPGRPKAVLELSDDERETLQRWARRPKSSQQLALRSRIVLACAGGDSNTAVAEQLKINKVTVGKWRARFVQHRLEGLADEPRPGAPRTVTDDAVEQVIVKTLESKPVDATHWSTRSMAAATGMSQSAISRIWRAFGLKPHRQETFKLSTDPAVRGQGPRRRRVVSEPTREGAGAVRGREDAGAGPGPVPAGHPDDARHSGTRYPRLPPGRHRRPVRRPRGRRSHRGAGDHPTPPPAPRDRVPKIPGRDRQGRARRLRRAPGGRQPLHPQDRRDPQVAPRPPPVPPALHPDRVVLAEPGRTLVRRDHHETHPPRRSPQRQGPRHRHPSLGQTLKQHPQAYVWTKTADEILNPLAAYCQRITDSAH